MIRPATLILFVLSVVSGGVLFGVAFEVSALEERLFVLNKEITDDRDAIHVLRAEWSYLNQPERLEGLSQRYLELQPLEGGQIAVIATVPARPDTVPMPADIAPDEPPALAVEFAGTLNARPKVKPAAPRPPARHLRLAAQKVAPRTAPTTTGMNASETAALDASLRAILGNTANSAGGARR
jgi:hypothetical protein